MAMIPDTLSIDAALRRLADGDDAPFDALEGALFARLHGDRANRHAGLRAAALAAAGAVTLGIAAVPAVAPRPAAPPVDPIAGAAPLAPSALLLASR